MVSDRAYFFFKRLEIPMNLKVERIENHIEMYTRYDVDYRDDIEDDDKEMRRVRGDRTFFEWERAQFQRSTII